MAPAWIWLKTACSQMTQEMKLKRTEALSMSNLIDKVLRNKRDENKIVVFII